MTHPQWVTLNVPNTIDSNFLSHEAVRPSLISLRLIAIIGQIITILTIQLIFQFPFPFIICLCLWALLALSNIWLKYFATPSYHFPITFYILLFDIIQLSALCFFTGGLKNPFIMLIVAPLVVATTLIGRRHIIILIVTAFILLTFLYVTPWSLPWYRNHLYQTHLQGILFIALAITILFTCVYTMVILKDIVNLRQKLENAHHILEETKRTIAIGSLATATAHTLGSPLTTINLISEELLKDTPQDMDYYGDLQLLYDEAQRCRHILKKFANNPALSLTQKEDLIRITPLIRRIVDSWDTSPYHKNITFKITPDIKGIEPQVTQTANITYALNNLIQNALQFAKQDVSIDVFWNEAIIRITVRDDGAGFLPSILKRVGAPYVSSRTGKGGHMGLGLFIAATLFAQTGGQLRVANVPTSESQGALLEVMWHRDALSP